MGCEGCIVMCTVRFGDVIIVTLYILVMNGSLNWPFFTVITLLSTNIVLDGRTSRCCQYYITGHWIRL